MFVRLLRCRCVSKCLFVCCNAGVSKCLFVCCHAGVETLSIQPRSTFDTKRNVRHSTSSLQPITDSEISVDFHLEETSNQVHSQIYDVCFYVYILHV